MAEEPQFHITVVTQQRRPRSDDSSHHSGHGQSGAPKPAQAQTETPKDALRSSRPASGQTGTGGAPAHGHSYDKSSHSHRRHYKDYGTVNLGAMDGGAEEADFTTDPDGPTPSQGELQKQFYNKYNDILSRRYFNRNRNKVTRIILIALLVGLIFIVSVIGIGAIHGSVAETLERPEVSTVPVGTLDLG